MTIDGLRGRARLPVKSPQTNLVRHALNLPIVSRPSFLSDSNIHIEVFNVLRSCLGQAQSAEIDAPMVCDYEVSICTHSPAFY